MGFRQDKCEYTVFQGVIKSVIYLEMIVRVVICKIILKITQISTVIQFSVATDPIRLYNRIVQCWRWFVVCKC